MTVLRKLVDAAHTRVYKARRDRRLLRAAKLFEDAIALEPGGPSVLFGRDGPLPVYPYIAALDTLDYTERTLWSDQAPVKTPSRSNLIGEAGHIEAADDSYDAVLASHVLEHLANPLGALAEWQRVVRPGGHLALIVPHREGTFDHRRAVTSVEHMEADRESGIGEDDFSHLDEVLALHDLARDPGAPSREVFEQRCRDNLASRAMHHHVFDTRSVVELCRAAGLTVVAVSPSLPFNVACVCRVGEAGVEDMREPAGEGVSDEELARVLARSPFSSDRLAEVS